MLFGYFFLKKLYTPLQIVSFSNVSLSPADLTFGEISVAVVSTGVLMTTLSRPSSTKKATDDAPQYFLGVGMLAVSSLLTGALGVLQEQTYHKYGPCWREGVFYTVSVTVCQCCYFSASLQHFLSLPIYTFLASDIKQGIQSLSKAPSLHPYGPYIVMTGNMVTQLICVSGVNRLTSVCKFSKFILADFFNLGPRQCHQSLQTLSSPLVKLSACV